MQHRKQNTIGLRALCLLLIAAAIFAGTGRILAFSKSRLAAAADQLEKSLKRAAASCYGAEGVYPATLEDLLKKCPLAVDLDRYTVHYEIFASNLMPEITVLENGYE